MTARAAIVALASLAAATPALAADPPVPIGMDPGGTAVAIVSSGINYTLPAVAARLARDGEGEMIAWDFADGDNRPYSGSQDLFGNLMAELMAKTDLRIIPIRVDLQRPDWLGLAARFAAQTPAAAVVLPMTAIPAEQERVKAIAQQFAKVHFVVVPASDALEATKAATAGLTNVGILADGMCTGHGGAQVAVELIGSRLCQPSEAAAPKKFRFAD